MGKNIKKKPQAKKPVEDRRSNHKQKICRECGENRGKIGKDGLCKDCRG